MPHLKGHNYCKKAGKKSRKKSAAAQGRTEQQKAAGNPETGGYYAMYKEAMLKFHNWMSKVACPNSKMSIAVDYCNGVQRILDHNKTVYDTKEGEKKEFIVAPPDVIASLALSIRLCEKINAKGFGYKEGGSLAHRYIIDVLKYCHFALRFANRMADSRHNAEDDDDEEKEMQTSIGDRLNVLTLDNADDEDQEAMDLKYIDSRIKQGVTPHYYGVEVEEEIDIKETHLLGNDRLQAAALFALMEDLMHIIKEQYGLLKDFMQGDSGMNQDSRFMELVLECTIVANKATESVNHAEKELAAEHPHLSSFYHVLALAFCSNTIAELNQLIDKRKLKIDPHMALHFAAELVESAFHESFDRGSMPSIVKRFVEKSGLDAQYVDKTARGIHLFTMVESLRDREWHVGSPTVMAKFAASDMKPNMWLRKYEYIGGGCCILNTQKLVQMIMNAVRTTGMPSVPLAYGETPLFDENCSPAGSIRGDLDQLSMTSILPVMLLACISAPVDSLPNRSHLITVLDFVKQQLREEKTKPVPIALSFGLHAMLMSILVLQGDGDLTRVAANTKKSTYSLFQQLQVISDRSKSPKKVRSIGDFLGFAKTTFANLDEMQAWDCVTTETLALWNPLIGGECMLYAAYICSLALEFETADLLGQLRAALHLYRGLKLLDPSLNIPFLHHMDTIFKSNKSVWVAGKPDKGSCCRAFWLSMGVSGSLAARLASGRADIEDLFSVIGPDDMLRICPKEIGASYRRLIQVEIGSEDLVSDYKNRNFSDETATAKNHACFIANPLKAVDITRDAMGINRESILSVNFEAVGAILMLFIEALSEHMGWPGMIQDDVLKYEVLSDTPTEGNLSDLDLQFLGLYHIWGRLLSCIDRDSRDFDVDKVSAFTKSFFKNAGKSRYTF